MELSTIGVIATAAAAVASIAFGFLTASRGTDRLRNQLRVDAEITERLPPGEAKDQLTRHIESKVAHLVDVETHMRRDWSSVALAVVGTLALSWAVIWLVRQHVWWAWLLLVPAACLALIFIYGFFESLQKAKRDGRGIRITGE